MEALKFNVVSDFRRSDFEESFITGYKKFALHKVEWMPEEEPKAILIVVHDIGDHILRFQNFANYFTSEGIGVIGIDLRGHGKSEGHRGSASYNDLLCDVTYLIKIVQHRYPYAPKIIYGTGMGANLAMLYAVKQKKPILGIIAAAPWLRGFHKPVSFVQNCLNLIVKILPFFTISNKITAKYLTHDLASVKKYNEDSFVHRRISPRLLAEMNKAGETILKNRHRCNIPLLLMHGTSDRITSWRASSEFTEYTSDNTILKLWEGHYHELHNEFDKEKIYEYILQWINQISSVKRVIYGNF